MSGRHLAGWHVWHSATASHIAVRVGGRLGLHGPLVALALELIGDVHAATATAGLGRESDGRSGLILFKCESCDIKLHGA